MKQAAKRKQHGFFSKSISPSSASTVSVPSSSGRSVQLLRLPRDRSVDLLVVSVPSSSGRSVQPWRLSCSRVPCFYVSVPSSSGRSVQPMLERRQDAPRHPGFQSPPHRGDRCNQVDIRPLRRTFTFQSPPHRGDRCNLVWAVDDPIIHQRFSPLLIGEIGATTSLSFATSAGSPAFQSPPHRGDRCNSGASGTSGAAGAAFQSPPHRGDRCNEGIPSRAPHAHAVCFSPLLIGEIGATQFEGSAVAEVGIRFQSPPHRGDRCNFIRIMRQSRLSLV